MGINPECWLLCVRITNVFTVGIMLAFQIWYIIELFDREYSAIITVMRMWLPCFIILFAIVIICAEFKLSSVMEHFKFLQFVPGLSAFYLFMAAIFSFEFSTYDEAAPIVVGVFFAFISLMMAIFACIRPTSAETLLDSED